MRIWSLHPKYLDKDGLGGQWREALGAKKCLEAFLAKQKIGYIHHPALDRFKAHSSPLAAINYYLYEIYAESIRRGYKYNRDKIDWHALVSFNETIPVTTGQVEYEWGFLRSKLLKRDPKRAAINGQPNSYDLCDTFTLVSGEIELWEKVKLF